MKSLKRTLWLIPILVAALLTTACSDLLSVEPLASDRNTVFDPALLGNWRILDKNDDIIVSVREGNNHGYDILWVDVKSDSKSHLDGQLVEINGQHVLDVSPHDADAGAFFVPGHAFLYLTSLPNGLKIQFLDSKWLQEQVTQSRLLPHSASGAHPVITATTADMQDFFTQFGLNEQARSEPITLRRLK